MRKCIILVLIFLFVLSSQLLADSLVVEKFSPKDMGKFPREWNGNNHKMTEKAKKIYKVLVNGDNAYLYAHSKGDAVQIGKKVDIDIKQFPILTWRWKVDKLCKGADERYKKTGDSAAAIYVVFPTWKKWNPKAIKYVWSASDLPIGYKTESPYASNTKIVILRNKNSPLHKWVQERVNVLEDYKYFFGNKIKHIKLIGIMTDSDNTHTEAIASYDEIVFESK